MEILFISSLSSESLINKIHERTSRNPGFAVQKFNRLIAKGLIENGVDLLALTNPPIPPSNSKQIWVALGTEKENGIQYKYMPFANITVIKHICIFLYSFFFVFFWGINNKREKAIVCDVLNISSNMGALLASKIINLRCVGIVTDMPGLMVGASSMSKNKNPLHHLAPTFNKIYIHSFSHYVFLTEQMNEPINIHNKPYIVMEALCDKDAIEQNDIVEKDYPRTILYAGGLHERYGLKMLTDAFMSIDIPDIRLVIYGSGPFVEELKEDAKKDSRIEYRGVATNDIVVDAERRATLLVNPRPTTEEFTKYSFPSKNMEYMVSGTPVLTTKLPGMPQDYYPYIYTFEEESVKVYAESIKSIMHLDKQELLEKGTKARDFVLSKKNNISQTQRIKELLQTQ